MLTTFFRRRYLPFYVLGVILLVTAGWLWWSKLALDPERVFWNMLEQSLRTKGVTMQSVQEDENGTFEQSIQYSLGAMNKAQSHTTILQGDAAVSTEVISTKEADYLRYLAIKSTRRDQFDQPLDFSKVVGVWAQSDGSQGETKLLGQALLGLSLPLGAVPVPIGNVSPEDRQKLLQQMRHEGVYTTDFSKAKQQTIGGRKAIVYDVKMQTIAYVNLMKSFAKASGLHDLDDLDPNSYQGAAPMNVRFTVDARAKHLVKVEVIDSAFTQTFSGYDVTVDAEVPKESISSSELQLRLDELQ